MRFSEVSNEVWIKILLINGSFWSIEVITLAVLLLLTLLVGIIYLIINRYNFSRNDVERSRLKSYRQKELVDSVISVNDKEGRRIAEDLHDSVGPILTALKQYIHTTSFYLKKGDVKEAEKLLEESKVILKDAVQGIREASYQLSPTYLDRHGIFGAIEEYINKLKKVSNITFSYTHPDDLKFDKDIGMNLYKIVLEMVNNSIKHANASEIDILFQLENHVLLLEYKDNGFGFDEQDVFSSISMKQGLGLNNIQSRVNYINGAYRNLSKKGKGTHYRIKVVIYEK